MTTVIYHSADYDGIFCREIAKKFLPDVNLIGWNFGDNPIFTSIPPTGDVYFMDLPVDQPMGFDFKNTETVVERFGSVEAIKDFNRRLIWIDHHKTSIETHPNDIPGYRIDGVAACRLAWQWFSTPQLRHKSYEGGLMPSKIEYVERELKEPLAVRLAGEYDVWDKRDPLVDTFQYGLRAVDELDFETLLSLKTPKTTELYIATLLSSGNAAKYYAKSVDAGNMHASFVREWEGLKFLCLNGRGNSLTFSSKDTPKSGHDALLMFYFQGTNWVISLYHARHRTELDLSEIAKKYGGGGHRGACGFTCKTLPFIAHEACEKGSF